MGEKLNLMDGLYITVSSMVIVFLILLLISSVLSLFKSIFKNETVIKSNGLTRGVNNNVQENGSIENRNEEAIDEDFDIDEEEKIVVALAASIMAGDGIPNPNLHIKKITRIS